MLPRVWSDPKYSFDNFGLAFQTLIEVVPTARGRPADGDAVALARVGGRT